MVKLTTQAMRASLAYKISKDKPTLILIETTNFSYGLNVLRFLICLGDAGKENAGQLVKDTHLKNGRNIDPNGIVTVANNHPAFLTR